MTSAGLQALLKWLPPAVVIEVVRALVLETPVLVHAAAAVCNTLPDLCGALVALLQPFAWHLGYIPRVPVTFDLASAVESPLAFLYGCTTEQAAALDPAAVAHVTIVDVDKGRCSRNGIIMGSAVVAASEAGSARGGPGGGGGSFNVFGRKGGAGGSSSSSRAAAAAAAAGSTAVREMAPWPAEVVTRLTLSLAQFAKRSFNPAGARAEMEAADACLEAASRRLRAAAAAAPLADSVASPMAPSAAAASASADEAVGAPVGVRVALVSSGTTAAGDESAAASAAAAAYAANAPPTPSSSRGGVFSPRLGSASKTPRAVSKLAAQPLPPEPANSDGVRESFFRALASFVADYDSSAFWRDLDGPVDLSPSEVGGGSGSSNAARRYLRLDFDKAAFAASKPSAWMVSGLWRLSPRARPSFCIYLQHLLLSSTAFAAAIHAAAHTDARL